MEVEEPADEMIIERTMKEFMLVTRMRLREWDSMSCPLGELIFPDGHRWSSSLQTILQATLDTDQRDSGV
jgi:hypothetical protein